MPFPWKKSRISQLVADHLHSPKRGRSLVVETGFPTSLIDLFVKNRDRMKKPRKKKRSTVQDPVITPPSPPLTPSNPLRPNTPSTSSGLVSEPENPQRCLTSQIGNEIDKPSVEPSIVMGSDTVVEEGVEVMDVNRVLVAVLKIFFVVVLALGSKRFVIGITMSAFFLFFLEYVGKYVYRLLLEGPSSGAQKKSNSMIERVLCFVRIKQDKLEGEIRDSKAPMAMGQQEFIVSDCCNLVEGNDLNFPASEIQIVEPKSNLVPRQIRSVNENFNTVGCNKRLGLEEMDSKKKGVMEKEEDYKCGVLEFNHRHSHTAKIKSKMKKLLPKTIRNSKKKCSDRKSEAHASIEEDKREEQEHDKDLEHCESECHDKLSMLSSGSYDGEEDVFEQFDAICSSAELSRGDSEATIVAVDVRRETHGNSGYWVLCLIVLIGLVGGRILALVFTLSWCLMLKSGGTLRRYIKLPMVSSSLEFSN